MPFCPPEMLSGIREGGVAAPEAPMDPRGADVWSLGVVELEMACGLGSMCRMLGWAERTAPCDERAVDLKRFFSQKGALPQAWRVRMSSDLVGLQREWANQLCRSTPVVKSAVAANLARAQRILMCGLLSSGPRLGLSQEELPGGSFDESSTENPLGDPARHRNGKPSDPDDLAIPNCRCSTGFCAERTVFCRSQSHTRHCGGHPPLLSSSRL